MPRRSSDRYRESRWRGLPGRCWKLRCNSSLLFNLRQAKMLAFFLFHRECNFGYEFLSNNSRQQENGMAYKALDLDPKTPPRVKSLIRSLENHYFSDVHTMLRLPEPDHELLAGCNFSLAQVLAAAVSGLSVTLYSNTGGSGKRFKGLLEDFYPWSAEPKNAVSPVDGAEVIYSVIRNPLTHDLGLD